MIPSPPFYLPQSFTAGNWGLHIPGITRSISTTERQANALLASAGPAMFHALQRLLLCPDLNEDSLSPETLKAIDDGLAALHKATTLPPQ